MGLGSRQQALSQLPQLPPSSPQPGTISTYDWHPSSPVWERLEKETQPHSPTQICTQDTDSSAAHFIFLEQINFPAQHEEDNVSRYPRSRNKSPILWVLVVSATVTCCPSRITHGLCSQSSVHPSPSCPCFLSLSLSLSPSSSLAGYNLREQENTNSAWCCLLLIRI